MSLFNRVTDYFGLTSFARTGTEITKDDGDRPQPSTAEKISATYGSGISGKIQFLPYLETPTQDTPEVRLAMRAMLKDPYVKAAWLTQCFSVAAEEFQVHSYKENDPFAQAHADFIKDAVNRLTMGFAELALSILLPLGPDGISIVEPVTEVESRGRWAGFWVPSAAKAKDLQNLYILGDRFRNITGIRSLRSQSHTEFPAHDFLIARYAPIFEEALGFAAFRSSYFSYWMLDSVRKLRAIHHEKRTAGTLIGKYKNDKEMPTLEATLRKLKSSTWAMVPESVQIDLLQLTGASDTEYSAFESDKIRDIVVGITFAELQMLSSPNERGNTEVHKGQTKLAIWYLQQIVQATVNRQWIPRYIDWNFGEVDGYPRLTIGGEDPENTTKLAGTVKAAQDLGFDDLDKDYYAKAMNLQRTTDEAKKLRPGGQGGQGGPMSGGPPSPPSGPPPSQPSPTGTEDAVTPSTDDITPEGEDLFGDLLQFAEPAQGFTGELTDAIGRKRKYVNGVQVARGQGQDYQQPDRSKPAIGKPAPETKPNDPGETISPQSKLSNVLGYGKRGLDKAKQAKDYVMDTGLGRFIQAAEHKLMIAGHKCRDVCEQAAKERGMDDEQAARLKSTLSLADTVVGWIGGTALAVAVNPAAGKVSYLPTVSAVYLAYSTAKNPKATLKAAVKVVKESSINPLTAVKDVYQQTRGTVEKHAELQMPGWGNKLADLLNADPELADWRQAVFLVALAQTEDPEQALEIAQDAGEPPSDQTNYAEEDWSAYSNPKTGEQGWKSKGGRVLYQADNPGKGKAKQPAASESSKSQAASEKKQLAKGRLAAVMQSPEAFKPTDLGAVTKSLKELTKAEVQQLARQLKAKVTGTKDEVINRVRDRIRESLRFPPPKYPTPPVVSIPPMPTPVANAPQHVKEAMTSPEVLAVYDRMAKFAETKANRVAEHEAITKKISQIDELILNSPTGQLPLDVHKKLAALKLDLYNEQSKIQVARLGEDRAAFASAMGATGTTLATETISDNPYSRNLNKQFPGPIDFSPTAKESLAKSNEWLASVVSGWGDAKVKVFPLANDGRANASTKLPGTDFQIAMPARFLQEGYDQSTYIHEVGHFLERSEAVQAKTNEFLDYRVGNEQPVRLKDLKGAGSFDDDEYGAKDNFDKAFSYEAYYVGKRYSHGNTEITSMGLEKLYSDPAEFAAKDPEYFAFMVSLLKGSK